MKTRKAFVTGGGGFMGQTLVPALRNAGMEVTAPSSKECDLRRADSLAGVRETFDYIFHLAAWTQAGEFCLHHQGEQWIINQQINTNVLTWWKEIQPQARTMLMGTSCAYDPSAPLVEDNFLKGEPISSLYTYAMTKRMLHVGALSLRKQFELEFMTLVPSTLCGPYYHLDGRQMHFIYDVVRKIIEAKETGRPAVLWGDGQQRREILHVEDFVSGMLQLVDDDRALGEVINLGAGRDYTVRDFAAEVCRQVGAPEGAVEYDTSRYVGAKSKLLDTAKIGELIQWSPRGMADCIHDVVYALRNNQ
ncbi:MAG: NAD-dependent epimerase/dehydratase family protein [Lentisphaerae bacterium]|nr:NAD-dependent epimerase/dehydratase family protein [Lentisphaerota bacterium]